MKKLALVFVGALLGSALLFPRADADVTLTDSYVVSELVTQINAALTTINAVLDTNSKLDGEQIADNTIDEDSIDWGTSTDQVSFADLPNEDAGDFTITSGSAALDAGVVDAAELASAIQDRVAYITVTGADLASAGTGTVTVQAKDAAGNNLSANIMCRLWVGTADDFGSDALTGFTSSTGTTIQTITANADLVCVSDANGVIVGSINNGGAGTVYAWAELGGRVVASGAIVLTAP